MLPVLSQQELEMGTAADPWNILLVFVRDLEGFSLRLLGVCASDQKDFWRRTTWCWFVQERMGIINYE